MAFRSFSILAVLISAVLAQSTSNPFIPSGISANCSSYLTDLNADASLTPCTSAFTTALQQFRPGANATPSSSDINNALSSLCSSTTSSACPQSTFTAQLAKFYAACSSELTSAPNQQVKELYDVLYTLIPIKSAVCAKDNNGKYCATGLSNSSSTGTVALVAESNSHQQTPLSQYLYIQLSSNGAAARRDLSNTTAALAPNVTTFQTANILFLFLQPSMPSSELCTTCTKNIMSSYISFESNCPYAPGFNSSQLLSGQVALYNTITSECGSNFLGGAVQAAGGLSGSLLSGATPRTGSWELSAAFSAILGVTAFMAASL